jgi:putative oxidoreductase
MAANLIDPIVALRITCGLFFIPHIAAKIFARSVTLGFFQAAGYRPAALFMYVALVVETAASLSLILGLFLPYMAWVAALFMLVAALSVLKVSKGQWLWNLGGCEYLLFWLIGCGIVALNS